MPNYYEEDYSTEYQNDEMLNDMFGAEDDADEAAPDIIRSFDTMTDEERRQAYGDMNFYDYLVELEELLNNSKRYFFNRNKRVVNAKNIGGIIDDLNLVVPTEIAKGNEIIAAKDKIISDANAEALQTRSDADNYNLTIREQADDYYTARIEEGNNEMDRIIENANREAARIVSEHEITRAAREEGNRIVGEATAKAKDIIGVTEQQVSDYKQQVNQWAGNAMDAVAKYCFELLVKSRQSNEANIRDIDNMIRQAQSDMQQIRRDIGELK